MYIYKYRDILKQKNSNNSRSQICQIFWLPRESKCEYHRHRFSVNRCTAPVNAYSILVNAGRKSDACVFTFELNIAGGRTKDHS